VFSNIWFYLIVVAVVIVFALAFYAGTLLMKLKQQKVDQQQAKLNQQQSLYTHDKKCSIVSLSLYVQ